MAGLKELVKYPGDYEVTVLARPNKRNQKKLKSFIDKGVNVVWGDLLDEKVLNEGIKDTDIVLHVGGMVSPMADHYPEKTLKVNVGSMQKIARIVKDFETSNPDREIKVVYIGSVAQYGSKLPPDHWGSADDELNPAEFDAYAESKVKAEEALKNAGLKKWVSIRQTSILHAGLLKNANNPVAFHTPIGGVLEWITKEDSGRLLERICRPDIPESFWGKCYNAGGGVSFRLTNLEFERGIMKAMGCPPPEKVFEPNWFAGRNFHGMWFLDSDKLDEILKYREKDTFEDALTRMKKELPFYFRLAPVVPSILIKAFMKSVARRKGLGPLSWIEANDTEKIRAFWGSRKEYDKIPDWNNFKEQKLDKTTPNKIKNS